MSSPASNARRVMLIALMGLALVYAFLAGLRTVADLDLGWQLATGRYVVQHHEIPSTDVFSYTARGNSWIYPPFSGVVFYGLYLWGGYAALSWLSALACVATVAASLWRGGRMATALAVLAVPSIAFRTAPRAELFTTLFFAVFLVLLWQQHRTGKAALWGLPLLMLFWVNLHLGFVSGLALLGAYAGLEILELPVGSRREETWGRLKRALPWLLGTVAVTVVNPWGTGIYSAIVRQDRIMKLHGEFIGEWSSVRLSWASLAEALRWRDPNSSYWWLLALAMVAIVVALARKQWGAALLLAGASGLSLRYLRFQGLFAVVAVVVGGWVLAQLFELSAASLKGRGVQAGTVVVLVLVAGLAGVRGWDLISNRTYLANDEISTFGAGEGWWFPEKAAEFLLRERLPGNIFHDYNLGGYLTWRIGQQYPDYLDGRAVPFGVELFVHQRALMQEPPDSPAWQEEAERRGINTLMFSVARYAGLGNIPLDAFCKSENWKPVYLDDVAVVFVRNRPENAALINRLKIDCATTPLTPPVSAAAASSARQSAELYNFYANAGSILYVLQRDSEALAAFQSAERIFADDPNLHLSLGQLLQAGKRSADAEREYLTAVRLRPSDAAWLALGRFYGTQHRYAEAVDALQKAAALSTQAYERYRVLGQIYVVMHEPRRALEAFDRAGRASPYTGDVSPLGTRFNALLAIGRARAWQALGQPARAVDFAEQAVKLAPQDAAFWEELAGIYEAAGQADRAKEAHAHALELGGKTN